MPTKTIPLFGSFTNRGDITKDQQFFNCFPKVHSNTISGKTRVDLYKRVGVASLSETTSNNTTSFGCCVWLGKADGSTPGVLSFVTSAGTATEIWRPDGASSASQIGSDIATTDACLFLVDTSVSGVSNITGVFRDSTSLLKEAWFFPEGGAWTQITDGDFPPNQGTPLPITPYIAHLDGYMFVMCDNGQIWNSDINSLANWTSTSFITANEFPDGGSGIARYKDYIVGFGSASIQFFYNAGNATGSPLSPVANSTINIGAVRVSGKVAPTIREIGNTVYWIGRDATTAKLGVYRFNGLQAEKVSNQTVDQFLNPDDAVITGICGGFSLGGLQHVMFYSGSSVAYNICYCIDNNFWWTIKLALQSSSIKGIASTIRLSEVETIFNQYTNADDIYRFRTDGTTADHTTEPSMIVRTQGLDFDTDEHKFVSEIWLDADTQASGTATLECSDDDYASWTTLGTFDMTSHEKRITRCGSHTGERAYRLTHSSDTAFRGRALRIKYSTP